MNPVDFLPRTIVAGADGTGFVAAHGYGVEVVDGGAYGPENVLTLVRGEDGISDGLAESDDLRCVPGTRAFGQFTGLRLVTPRTSPVLDRVKVRVITNDGVRAVDTQPAGKPRVRFLSRGSLPIAVGAYGMLWASATLGEFDRFSLEEQFDPALRWYGWIGCLSRLFTVYIFVSPSTTNPGGNWYQLTNTPATKHAPGAGAPPHSVPVGSFIYDFTEASTPLPYPAGSVEVWAKNTDVGDETLEWFFGVTG